MKQASFIILAAFMFLLALQASEATVYEKEMNDLDAVNCKMTLEQIKKMYGSKVEESNIFKNSYHIYNMNIYNELSYILVAINNEKIIYINYVFHPTENDSLVLVKSYFNIEKNLIKEFGSSYKISDEWTKKPASFSTSKYAEELKEGRIDFRREWQTDSLYISHILGKRTDNNALSFFGLYTHFINKVCIQYSKP